MNKTIYTYVLTFPVIFADRKDVESIENELFKNEKDLDICLAQNNLKVGRYYELSEFMDALNNNEIQINQNWVCYVRVKNQIQNLEESVTQGSSSSSD